MDPREERIEALYSDRELDSRLIGEAIERHTASKEVRATDPVTGGQKGTKIARFFLLPWDVLWAIAEHFGKGANKYADRNWEKGYKWSYSFEALQRHLAAFWHGTDDGHDPSLGHYKHIVAVAWHSLVLCAFALRGVGTDDRPLHAVIPEAQE